MEKLGSQFLMQEYITMREKTKQREKEREREKERDLLITSKFLIEKGKEVKTDLSLVMNCFLSNETHLLVGSVYRVPACCCVQGRREGLQYAQSQAYSEIIWWSRVQLV